MSTSDGNVERLLKMVEHGRLKRSNMRGQIMQTLLKLTFLALLTKFAYHSHRIVVQPEGQDYELISDEMNTKLKELQVAFTHVNLKITAYQHNKKQGKIAIT